MLGTTGTYWKHKESRCMEGGRQQHISGYYKKAKSEITSKQ